MKGKDLKKEKKKALMGFLRSNGVEVKGGSHEE